MTTRPILDRAKQMLFDRLEQDLREARVLDVYAGTGSLGLEALSRGAKTCVFIEQDHKAHQLLRENVTHVGADEFTLCWRTDALKTSYQPQGVPDFLPYRVIFFDPPYPLAQAQLKPGTALYKSLQRLGNPNISDENALLVLRVPEHMEPIVPECWVKTDLEMQVASMRMQFYERQRQPV